MTNEQQKAKELAELLNAFAGGKQLEYQSEQFVWCGASSLAYIADSVINGKRPIRIKPEPKRVPLNQQDLIERIKDGKTMWVQLEFRVAIITDFMDDTIGDNRVYFQCDQSSYKELAKYNFIDGTPCSKEVECE